MPPPDLFVAGRFPPPLDGQTLATQRLASLLSADATVERVDLNPGGAAFVESKVRFRTSAARFFFQNRRRLQAQLARAPRAPVLWTTISPTPLGHLRDILTVAPAFQEEQRVLGVVHHGNFSDAFEHPLTRRTAERLVRQIDGIVFLSDALAERCAPWIPAEKRFVVPNTIDDALLCTDAEVEAKQAKRGEARPLRLLFFSHMIRSKGYMDVLAAVARLHARGLAVHADFVGRWDAEEAQPAFERAVREHGLQDVVAHHGGLYDRDAAKALYLAADVFLLPTYYPTEAQPLTVIEALNAGTPVVVTPHASLPEMINEGAEGHFVPPSAPEAIAEAVERLADPKHWTHASERARVRFETMFSPDAVRSRWAAVLGDPAARNA